MNNDVKSMNTTALAYLGDAVYELEIREKLLKKNKGDAGRVHNMAITYVSSDGQAKAVKELINGFLNEEEIRLVKRARNKRATSRPKNADPRKYKLATGFEALIGALYLDENIERLNEVLSEAVRVIEEE